LIILSGVLFFQFQKSVKEFKNEEITKHMKWMGNSVIYFCNVSYDSLARVGGLDDTNRLRLKQLEALETIEDFARSNDFKIVVNDESNARSYLLLSSFPDDKKQNQVFSEQPLYKLGSVKVNGLLFNTFNIHFDSWNWQIVLFKSSGSYDTLLSRLNIFYVSFGLLLGLLCIIVILFFNQFAKTSRILRLNELELKSTLDSLSEGVITVDSRGLILQMNPASISLANIAKNKLPIGQHISDTLDLTVNKKRETIKKLDFEDGGSENLLGHNVENFNLTLPDGTERTIQMQFGRRSPSENVEQDISLVISFHDVSEKIRMQEMMMQSEKMLSVGGLAAGMAHEINNPLAGIMQNTQLIKNRLTSSIPANEKVAMESKTSMESIQSYVVNRKILRSLGNILDAGSNAAKIVDNMLSFAKKGNSSKAIYNIRKLLEKTLELAKNDYDLKKKYDFKQIRIVKEFDSDIPNVPCEESKIMQVFYNIIKNATEAMYTGEGKIKNSSLTFRTRNLKKMVQIEIEDNGPGMDEPIRKRVFEPFFTTKDVNKGTGLGLSLSYFIIVEDHDGEMEVESTIGKGTKFIIKLPK